MLDYDYIFNRKADQYDRLVKAEDYQGNLLQLLKELSVLSTDSVIADLGTGTGRMALMMAPCVKHVFGVEPVEAMRRVAEQNAESSGIRNVTFLAGEHKHLPLADGSVDAIVEGWAFLRAFRTSQPAWEEEFSLIRKEMRRVLKGTGPIVLIETMGTFDLWEQIPDGVRPLYDYFEGEMGLKMKVIRTDYRFQSVEEAVELGSFFFGEETGAAIRAKGERIVPEATAVWYGSLP